MAPLTPTMSRSRRLFLFASLIVVSGVGFVSFTGAADRAQPADDSLYKNLSIFTEVINLVRRAYVDETSVETLMAGALDGATDALAPFATWVPADQLEGYLTARSLGDSLSGLTVAKDRGIAFLAAVSPGSPAAAAGLERGDVITDIDGLSSRDMPLWRIERLLAGPEGETVSLQVLHAGEEKTVELRLAPFAPPVVETVLSGEVPVLRVPSFGPDTADRVRAELERLEAEGRDRLLLDVRDGVPGDPALGYEVASAFVTGELGLLAGRAGTLARYDSQAAPAWSGFVVVLVDRGTMGAAEVVAEVLRQGAGAELVGQRTFGFAARRGSSALSDGSRLFLADAFYAGPDGEPIRGSLVPDLVVSEGTRAFAESETPLEELTLEAGRKRLLALTAEEEREAA